MQPPVLQALLICDQIYQDRATGKMVIAGTFGRIWNRKFPSNFHRSTHAYVSLTGVHGKTKLDLRYVALRNNELLMELKDVSVESPDPLSTVELAFEVPPLPIPEPGAYSLEVCCGEEILGSLRIIVSKLESSR